MNPTPGEARPDDAPLGRHPLTAEDLAPSGEGATQLPDDHRSKVRARIAVSFAFAVQGFGLAILVTRVPTLKERLAISDGELGLYLVLVPVLAGVGSALAGFLTTRMHSKPVLRVAGPMVMVAVLLVGAAPNKLALSLGLAFLGLCLGVVDATLNMQGVSLTAAYARPVLASCYAWFSVSSIVGALLAAGDAALGVPLVVFFAVCALVVIPLYVVIGRDLLPDAVVGAEPGTHRRVPWAPIILIGLALTCAYVLDSATQNWSAVYLTDTLGSAEAVAALGYGAYQLFLLIGRFFADRLETRTGPVWLVRVGAVAGIVALMIVAVAPAAPAALIGFALLGLAFAPMMPLAFVAAASHDPDATGRAVSRVNIFSYVGVLLGAPIIGIIAEFSSMRLAFALMAVVCVALLGLAGWFRPAVELDD